MIIKLVRHAESTVNAGHKQANEGGDFKTPLTERGIEQATQAGVTIGKSFLQNSLIYTSPYVRARQTTEHLIAGAGIESGSKKVYEDPRLREVDIGYNDLVRQQRMRLVHGWFYYRFDNGESPADCYDRMSTFLESMMREIKRRHAQRILIVTHGLALRCFLMRFMHLTVEQFDTMRNPDNADVITISDERLEQPTIFKNDRWAVAGIRVR